MRIAPWPSIYVPPLELKMPTLRLSTSAGERDFGADETLMYVCGITPYDSTHLGHAATYLTFDLINRYISCSGGQTLFVENITDIDEPLLQRATRDQVDWKDLALGQVQLFQSDMSALHILPPAHFVPATSAMNLVDQAITRMKINGFVYEVENDLYFDCSKFLDKLPISLDEALAIFAERGGDPTRSGKKHPLDPVLWIANRDNEPGWESSHGFGRPGWHVECCVISLHYLLGPDYLNVKGRSTLIDIQGGGSDLIFPHHFMSGAQAQAMTGIEFAKAYVHTGMVGLDGEKMSKSKGNLVFVSKLISEGVDPMIIRYALLQSKYSEDRMWSDSVLDSAYEAVNRIRLNLSKSEVSPAAPLLAALSNALSNDLDTPAALLAINQWCEASEENPSVDEAGIVARALDSLMGLAL
jgi:L-cysteine:1D-myo-inositol 2-amino-2-deoxy-alpha-D-glucopyranoside ligase